METSTSNINKSVVTTYEDCNRMINFCKDEDQKVSRDFYDWYLKERPELFIKSGMLLVDPSPLHCHDRVTVSFDFTNPDECEFCSYVYKDQSIVCKWVLKRWDNITMDNVQFDFSYLSLSNFKKINFPSGVHRTQAELDSIEKKKENATSKAMLAVEEDIKNIKVKGKRQIKNQDILDKATREGFKEIVKIYAQGLTYFVYALMYYVSKQEKDTIETTFSEYTEDDIKKVKGFYKYTGYVDLRENKIYKPTIERNPNDPVRDYHRHIEAWTVRGHYRKTSKGLVWIEPHIKGKGQLEKRIYGTEDEKDLNLIPKVFEVEKTVKATIKPNMTSKEMSTAIVDSMIETMEKNLSKSEDVVVKEEKTKTKTKNKFILFIKNVFKRFFTDSKTLL